MKADIRGISLHNRADPTSATGLAALPNIFWALDTGLGKFMQVVISLGTSLVKTLAFVNVSSSFPLKVIWIVSDADT